MSIVMAVLAGVSAVKAKQGSDDANASDRQSDILSAFQGEINAQQAMANAAVSSYNMTQQYNKQTSANTAVASAMGKSATGGSAEAIRAEGERTLNRDITDQYRQAEAVADSERISASGRSNATAGRANSRRNSNQQKGLLLASKLF